MDEEVGQIFLVGDKRHNHALRPALIGLRPSGETSRRR